METMSLTANQIWNRCCADFLQPELNELSYKTWFEPAEPYMEGDRDFILSVPNTLSADYLGQYGTLIRNALQLATGVEFNLRIEVNYQGKVRQAVLSSHFFDQQKDPEQIEEPKIALHFTPQQPDAVPVKDNAPMDQANGVSDPNGLTPLNPHYNFESFVVGPGNNFAYAASVAISAMQGGQEYNPLFLYGGSGLGKTHLMQAIGNAVKEQFPEKKVVYVQTERFVNEFIQVIKSKKFDEFRAKYRLADLLLIDDIQFIEGKEQMQEEFFHTFNTLYESHKNIVLTCDQPPHTLTTLEERLKTRFSSGLIVDIAPPDYETRVAILRQLADQHGIRVPDDVYDYIATNVNSNIRELEGAFKTLMAYCLISGPIDLKTAKEALKSTINPNETRRIDCDLVMQVVANYYNLSPEDLMSKSRSQDVAVPRQIAMYLCRQSIDMTFQDIGDAFGGRNHATVIHAYDKIKEGLKDDRQLQRDIDELGSRMES